MKPKEIPAAEKQRQKLYGMLGDLPERHRKISVQVISCRQTKHYVLEKLILDLNGLEPVPAYFLKPRNGHGPHPTILYNHAHGGHYDAGKEELIKHSSDYLVNPPYSEILPANGYAVLCIDHWLFGERHGTKELTLFKQMLWEGRVLWGMMVYDSLRAMDYLATRPEVDAQRIGTMGLSMGSTMAWWLAALDPRVKVCVDLCCLTDFQALIAARGLEGHGIYYYVPSLLKHFTTAEINALIAPRPHLALEGKRDILTPLAGLKRIDRELRKVYQETGAAEAWKMRLYDSGHGETPAMRQAVMAFLKKHLPL